MEKRVTGHYKTTTTSGEVVNAFIPNPLPPMPLLVLTSELQWKLDKANLALGRLDSISTLLPDISLFLYMYVRKEAVLSSRIEGTQSSLSDLLLFELDETPGVPVDDVKEVSNYVAAMEKGLELLHGGLPLCGRVLREIHAILLSSGRGMAKQPGEYRRSQNWLGDTRPGNARFVPAPPDEVPALMADLEKFIHESGYQTPVLIKAALAHVQFETIHPFLDGNGRLGRMLITLLLYSEGVLREPLLYLSLYFKANRTQYYELLQRVRTEGDWEAWIEFFAEAVEKTAEQAVATTRNLLKLAENDRERIRELRRVSGTVMQVHHAMQVKPINTIQKVSAMTGLTQMTVTAALKTLEKLGIVNEITGKKRHRHYSYESYIKELSAGIDVPLIANGK
ncbi:MAG: Fic family protein [Fibrobacterota bacterium]